MIFISSFISAILFLIIMKKFLPWTIGILFSVFIFSLYLAFWPILLIIPTIKSSISYDEGESRLADFKKADTSEISDKCKSITFDHGKKVEKSIVFFHGFTNCPEQFRLLGEQFFDMGYNVFIPRMPFHGYKDRLTDAQTKIQPYHLTALVRESVFIASGLGEHVTLSGISGGGVLASWGAFYYPQVRNALVISPLFAPYGVPDFAIGPIVRIRNEFPEYYRWWDPETKEKISGPNYAYPRFSFKAVFSFLEVGYYLEQDIFNTSKELPNKDMKISYLSTENDIAVKNSYNEKVLNKWATRLNIQMESYQFTSSYNFNHDIIDPNQATANTDLVYGKILELVE